MILVTTSSLLVLLLSSQFATADYFMDATLSPSRLQEPVAKVDNVVIELLIVCDMEFSHMFQFNRSKIIEYFTALFWDVHIRYQTLQNVKISFHVNEIVLLKNAYQQIFVDWGRESDGSISAAKVLPSFSQWLYHAEIYRNYDIAIAAIGTGHGKRDGGAAYQNSPCLVNANFYQMKSCMAVIMSDSDPSTAMTHEIAHLLGAQHDNDEGYSLSSCGPYDPNIPAYIMDTGAKRVSYQSYFFSNCSDKTISKFVQTKQARSCLRDQASYPSTPLIDTAELFRGIHSPVVGKVSIERQCQVAMKGNSVFLLANETRCIFTICRHNSTKQQATVIRPMDGSPCNENTGFCFRGHCLSLGGHLRNVGTGKCFKNNNRHTSKRTPILTNCNTVGNTPLDLIHFERKRGNEILIYTIFSTADGLETFKQCLNADENNRSYHFERCSYKSLWEMIIQSSHVQSEEAVEFLLKHKETQKCLMSAPTSNALKTATCSENNANLRWSMIVNGTVIKSHDSLHNLVEENPSYVTEKCAECLATYLGILCAFYVGEACLFVLGKCLHFIRWGFCV